MATCNTSTYTNILDLPQALDITTGNYLIVEKPDEGTYILDFSDFIITLENTTFAPLIFSLQTQITQLSAITQTFVNNLSGSNVLIGIEVGTNITTGLDNIAIGKSSMSQSRVVGSGNIGIGSDTLDKITDGTYNIGIGRLALANLTTGDNNIAVGTSVMSQGNVINNNNIAIGRDALDKLTSGNGNIGIGASVMSLCAVTGLQNVGIGLNTARKVTSGNYNVAVGTGVMYDGTVTGSSNVGVGINGLFNLTSGTANVALGRNCAGHLTTGTNNVAIGTEVMYEGEVTGEFNVAVGARSLDYLTSGRGNVGVGCFVMNEGVIQGNTATGAGSYNVGLGYNAMSKLTTGLYNVGLGTSVMSLNNIFSAGIINNPTSIMNGWNLNGALNVGVGVNALDKLTCGVQNVAIGHNTLQAVTSGSLNIGIGSNVMTNTGEGTVGNIGIGWSAGTFMQQGADYNIAIGTNACERMASNADYNVGIGFNALGQAGSTTSALSGRFNVGLGYYAGQQMLSGNSCIFIGNNAGVNTQNTRGASDIVCLGTNTGFFTASSVPVSRSVAIGYNALVRGSDQIVLGDGNATTYTMGGTVQTISDARDKTEITDSQLGLEFINKLRPVEYRYDLRDNYYDSTTNTFLEKDGTLAGSRPHYGLIAQEVKQVIDEMGIDFGGYQDMKVKGGADRLSLGYVEFIAPLIKAVQQLSTQNQELLSRIEALESAS